ncbi:hypothetical protein LIER_08995 [Lithospermum erythrorhizon]|uniref:BAHD acyltransferase DCR n=1 Tax=Lithospermum erythrorhizon TaxID=34254 RepID=A0AAV3PDY1_LITER
MPSSSVQLLSKCTIYPDKNSSIKSLKLSVSDLPMLSCHYIQKGVLLSYYPPQEIITNSPSPPSNELIQLLKLSLSKALSFFPPLAGHLETDQSGHVHIVCNDSGVDFFHARAPHLSADDILPGDSDIPACFREFFQFDYTLSYAGHQKPLISVQITELNDAIFIACMANHAVVDGTSFWNFFNTFAEVTRGVVQISKPPEFSRDTVFNSPAVLKVNAGGPSATFDCNAPLRERIFHFSREAILKIKFRANNSPARNSYISGHEGPNKPESKSEISSFQSLCALLWRSVTRSRNFDVTKTTTFRMAVNCRHRVDPKMAQLYFGNAIQSIPTLASVGDLLSNDLNFSGGLLHRNVAAHDNATVLRGVKEWEENPRLFPLGNFDGAMITMGSSPRFPMYDNDFGWGRPLAIRSGRANKFDGKISAFPGRDGNGSVDLEVVLAPSTMAGLELDLDFIQYVS